MVHDGCLMEFGGLELVVVGSEDDVTGGWMTIEGRS